MATLFKSLSEIILPKGRGVKDGRGYTPTFDPRQPVLTAPLYREHLTDLYNSRIAGDSRSLIETMANADPDVSAAINAFLSVAGSSDPVIYAYDEKDEPDADGVVLGQQILAAMTTTNDYSIGFSNKPTVDELCTAHRYLILLRGSTAAELVLNKAYIPSEIRWWTPLPLNGVRLRTANIRLFRSPLEVTKKSI